MTCGFMSDQEWTCLEPFVINSGAGGGCRSRNHRLAVDGVFRIARKSVPRRDLALRSAKGSAPDPDAPFNANPKSNPKSELRNG